MNDNNRMRRAVSVCNELLLRELAAVEVYDLAVKLLDRELGGPDYEELRQAHQERVERLICMVEEQGGTPRSTEISWDRPRTAVLCAATLYGTEAPQPQLLEMENEIMTAYQKAAQDEETEGMLRRELSGTLLSGARGAQSVLSSWGVLSLAEDDDQSDDTNGISQSTVA